MRFVLRFHLCWLMACCMLLLAGATPVEAYKFMRKGENNRTMSWKRARFPIPITLDSGGSPDFPAANGQSSTDIIGAILGQAIASWNAVDCTVARMKYSGVVRGAVAPKADNTNVIKFVQSAGEWPAEWPRNQFAVTVVTAIIRTGEIIDADMLINDWNFKFSTTGAAGVADLQATLTHELGHVLGLGHSEVADSSMYYTENIGATGKRNVKDDDKRGLCDLYPDQPCREGVEDTNKKTVCYNGRMFPVCAPYSQACVPCKSDLDCFGDKNFCITAVDGGRCGYDCTAANAVCETGYACTPVQDANQQPLGKNCIPANQSRTCAGVPAYPCCRDDNDCMPTYSCQNQVCVRETICRKLTETCSDQQTCCSGMTCVEDGTGPKCREPCNPLEPQCPKGSRCGLAGVKGFCVPPNGGGQEGAECNNTSRQCEHEFLCDPLDSRCRFLCNPTKTGTCPLGYTCKATGGNGLGLCYKGGRACKATTECPSGEVCQNGFCRPCGNDSECPTRNKCVSGKCLPICTQDSDCTGGRECKGGVCEAQASCTGDSECPVGQICKGGTCQNTSTTNCKSDADCSSGQVCQNGVCQLPDSCNNKCKSTERCLKAVCVPLTCSSDGQCGAGFLCRNQQCIVNENADCGGTGPCPEGKECYQGSCVGKVGAACLGDETCSPGLTCYTQGNVKRCTKICADAKECPDGYFCVTLDGLGSGCWRAGDSICENGTCFPKRDGCGCNSQSTPPFVEGLLVLLLLLSWSTIKRSRHAKQ